jgi:hypothetical protein
MAVRDERAARFRRAASGRAGFVALAVVLYLAAGVAATWPAVLHARSHFLSGGAPGHGEASPGDHLQTLYHYWLVGHQLEDGGAPWRDPYSFRPEAGPQANYPGWPYGFLFWPLSAVFGMVGGWNVLQLLVYALAGLAACAWLRELGLPRGPALAGGLAFAIAPYRVEQSVGHLLGPISVLLAVALWAVERARRRGPWWLAAAGAALASIPLSGQVHLALGAIPFFLLYALVRLRRSDVCVYRRHLVGSLAVAAAAVGAGILVRETVIKGSTQAGGRSLDEVSQYSARWGDFLSRHVDHARSEQFVFLGWATPLIALAGLAVLLAGRRYGLAVVLGLGALVPIVLALGTRTPIYSALWHALPPFRFPRVPERLLPIGCLCIAALVAYTVARFRAAWIAVLAVAVLFVDLHARVYGKSAPGERPVTRIAGRVLELPVFDPGIHFGSVYLWYDTAEPRQRPGGYSTTAPKRAKTVARRLERLNCGDWSGDTAGYLRRFGVTTIEFHPGLFLRNAAVPNRAYFAWRGLARHGWGVVRTSGVVPTFERWARGTTEQPVEPDRAHPVFCQGWYGDTGSGRYMSEEHAPFWLYGARRVTLKFASSQLPRRFTVDGRRQQGPRLDLGKPGWHVITVDVPHLVRGPNDKKVGVRLLAITSAAGHDQEP